MDLTDKEIHLLAQRSWDRRLYAECRVPISAHCKSLASHREPRTTSSDAKPLMNLEIDLPQCRLTKLMIT